MSAGKISTTAYIVATAQCKLASLKECRTLFSDEEIYFNHAFSLHAKDSFIKSCIALLPARLAIFLMELLFIPGLAFHYILRKRFIEEHVRKAITDETITQVINLGAGFDTLALRLAKEYPEVNFFEIDLPETQQAKIKILERMEYTIPANAIFIPADLGRQKISAVLTASKGMNNNLATFVIIEGVLMYLRENEVKTLFTELHGLFSGALRIAFGALNSSSQYNNWTIKCIKSFLKKGNEAYRWTCSSEGISYVILSIGYRMTEWITYKNLQRQNRSETDIKKLPEEDENYYIIDKY